MIHIENGKNEPSRGKKKRACSLEKAGFFSFLLFLSEHTALMEHIGLPLLVAYYT